LSINLQDCKAACIGHVISCALLRTLVCKGIFKLFRAEAS
jgi:hypothetical protein